MRDTDDSGIEWKAHDLNDQWKKNEYGGMSEYELN